MKFRGATLRHATPPFTQERIVALDRSAVSVDVQIDPCYPTGLDDNDRFMSGRPGFVFDPKTRLWREGSREYKKWRIRKLGDGLFRLDQRSTLEGAPLIVGDLMAFQGRGGVDIHVNQCERMVVVGVTVLDGGGYCVLEEGARVGASTATPSPEGRDPTAP